MHASSAPGCRSGLPRHDGRAARGRPWDPSTPFFRGRVEGVSVGAGSRAQRPQSSTRTHADTGPTGLPSAGVTQNARPSATL